MAKVDMMDVLVAMAKAVLEVAGETAVEPAPAAPKAEKPAKKEKTEKIEKAAQKPAAEDTGDADLESKTTKELYQMCIDAGIQVPKYGKNKAFYIEALQAGGVEAPATEPEDKDEEEVTDEYAGKTAKELFDLCKKRGIKAAPKKKAEVYIELLRKADEEAATVEEEADDDDWGDEEPEEEKPAKKQPAKPKAAAKKPAPKEDDDDDDWDI